MKKLDSFEVFKAIKDGLELFFDNLDCYTDTYEFRRIFDVDGCDYVIRFDYHTCNSRIVNLYIYDYFYGQSVDVDNREFLKGLILGCILA